MKGTYFLFITSMGVIPLTTLTFGFLQQEAHRTSAIVSAFVYAILH